MAKLKIFKGQNLVQEITLDPQQTYLAGRGDQCQIALDPEPGISRQHLQLTASDGGWKVEVLSRYGEFYVNGEKSGPVTLKALAKFSIPPYDFEYEPQSEGQTSTKTKAEGQKVSASISRTEVAVVPSVASLKLYDVSGKLKQIFRLEGDAWVAGRDVTCSLFIDNAKVSRKQFELYCDAQLYFIRDLGSANGTQVNSKDISAKEWTQLESGDKIKVVDWYLQFEIKDAAFEDRVQEVPIHAQSSHVDAPTSATNQFSGTAATQYGPPPTEQQLPPPPPLADWNQNVFSGGGPAGPPPVPPMGAYNHDNIEAETPPQGGLASFRAKMNPVRWLMLLLILGGGGYYAYDTLNVDEAKPAVAAKPKSPFDRLSPEDQQFVMQAYKAATTRMERKEFAEALQEIARIKEKIPSYEESDSLEKAAKEGIAQLEEIKHEEQLERERLETEEKIQKAVADCQKKLNPKTSTVQTVENCLAAVISLNPEHPAILGLKAQAEKFEVDCKVREDRNKEFANSAAKLKLLFKRAQDFDTKENFFDAIPAYALVEKSKLPDPIGLKTKAKDRRLSIIAKMADDQKNLEAEADQFIKDGKPKDAVISLRKALKINPDNEVVKGHLAQALLELRKLVQPSYQESILDESVGDVEVAKSKWKKIVDLSLPGEDYYEKARLKLKKYGAML